MNDQTDQQLLRAYAEHQSEAAFAAIVRRYVDLVYSAALRLSCDAHAAEDVTQSVFIALARNARHLTDRPALAGWLHGTARNLAIKAIRSDARRRAREQEAALMNELLSTHPDASWEHIAPHLDEALGELSEPDRDAVLLRYFKNHDLRTVGATLGITDDAAQKRVSRAVERLREFFAKRGVTVGASGLVVVISANAVQAAPVGLALTISTAALAGTTLAATATATATKAIAMTTLQKTIIATILTTTVGAGIYEARQASNARAEVQTLLQQQAPLAEQIQQLEQERDNVTKRLTTVLAENEQLRQNTAAIPTLRAQVAQLQAAARQSAGSTTAPQNVTDPFTQSVLALLKKAARLNQQLDQMPDKKIPELRFLTENDWLDAARDANLESDTGIRQALAKLRSLAKNRSSKFLSDSLAKYLSTSNGQLPADPMQLKPYLDEPLDDSFLQRYKMLRTGSTNGIPEGTWVIGEKAPVDRDFDSHLYIGLNGRSGSYGTGPNSVGDPDASWATGR